MLELGRENGGAEEAGRIYKMTGATFWVRLSLESSEQAGIAWGEVGIAVVSRKEVWTG